MKTFVRHAVALVAITVVCQSSFTLADDYYWVDGGNRTATLVGDEKVAGQGQACATVDPVSCCPDPTCGSCCCDPGPYLGCDCCPCRGIVGFFGVDAFKGISDDALNSNFGAVAGLNSAIGAFGLADYGIGWQLGMSYGVYDWNGGNLVNPRDNQQQMFVTTGFFRKAAGDQRLSFGIVYDWMINDNWGVFGVNPTMGQWRGQIEWAVSGSNAFGLYGCIDDLFSVQNVQGQVTVRNQSLTQVNLFWHHKFVSGADSWLWVGAPENVRLGQPGSLGDFIVGANIQVPISERLALYGNAQYMHPSAAVGPNAAIEEDWNIGAGIVWYFGGHARSDKINGKCWLPYMPVANNSTFLVDQGVTVIGGP